MPPARTQSSYFQYFDLGLAPLLDRILERKRREVVRHFLQLCHPQESDYLLDIGVSSEEHSSSNMLEKVHSWPEMITALGVEDHQSLELVYPGLRFVQGDGRRLPFEPESFDFVYSHAVIEHVGSREQQCCFLAEALRVARKAVFITTPDRSHPLEFHTGLPLIHYLPHRWYRRMYRLLGRGFYATEANLNLLTGRELVELAKQASAGSFRFKLVGTRFLGMRSNLLLVGWRTTER